MAEARVRKAGVRPGRAALGGWRSVGSVLRDPRCDGVGSLQLVGRLPFWDEEELPFTLFGGGTVFRLVPDRGFRKESLAASTDERLLIVDCPDAEGWLVPQGIIAEWLSRHVTNAQLDDLLLGHPLYEHLTRLDERGHSRAGRARLIHWTPGVPTAAIVRAPEFLPDDREAPAVNRSRPAYAAAVTGLLRSLSGAFDLLDIEVGLTMRPPVTRPSPR
jgi:hypothetical protein